jgi:hypothetical protein
MPNGDELNEQLEFKQRIKSMTLEERSVFNAEGIYALTEKMEALGTKMDSCLIDNKKSAEKFGAASGGLISIVVGIIAGLFNYFTKSG